MMRRSLGATVRLPWATILAPIAQVAPFARVAAIAAIAATTLLPGCSKSLDETQCKQLADKLIDLAASEEPADRARAVKDDVRSDPLSTQNVRESCVGKMTRSQLDCVMEAKTFRDAVACDK